MLSVKSVWSFRKSALTMLLVSYTTSACAVAGQDSAACTCATSIERGASGVWHDVFGKQGQHSRRRCRRFRTCRPCCPCRPRPGRNARQCWSHSRTPCSPALAPAPRGTSLSVAALQSWPCVVSASRAGRQRKAQDWRRRSVAGAAARAFGAAGSTRRHLARGGSAHRMACSFSSNASIEQ